MRDSTIVVPTKPTSGLSAKRTQPTSSAVETRELRALVVQCFDFVQKQQPDPSAAQVIAYFQSVHPNQKYAPATMYRMIKACKAASLARRLLRDARDVPSLIEQIERERDAHRVSVSEIWHLKARVDALEHQVSSLLTGHTSARTQTQKQKRKIQKK